MATLAWEPDEEDRAFTAVYGAWDPLTPAELARLMDGFPAPWWIVGGHAIEAFTGVPRVHEDIDLVVFRDAVPALREQLGGHFHLWSNHGGTFRIIDDAHPEPLHPLSQIWMRVDASSPWRVDCILNDVREGRWVSRRDDAHVADLDEVTFVADGIRYQRPEVQLLIKARLDRVKDRLDLDVTWPLLDDTQRTWLRETLRRTHPGHGWQPLLDS
ncbi:MAG: hypothetical protein ACXVW6_07395 [Nocardioidaceae bacterium]